MSPDDVERHKIRRQLLKVVRQLHSARHEIVEAFKPSGLTYYYSDTCKDVQENIKRLFEGTEETIKLASKESRKLYSELENRLEKPPPEFGAFLSGGGRGKQRITPAQRQLEKEGFLKISTIPKTSNPIKKKEIKILPFTPYERKKKKPRSRTQLGIPI